MARLQIDLQGNISQFAAQIQVANGLLADLQNRANINLGASGGGIISPRSIAGIAGLAIGLSQVYKVAKQATQSIIDFDSGLINVSKTTGISGKELQNLSDDMINLSRRLQVIDTSKLLEYATVAGQLGIHGSRDIQSFSEALAKMETATDVSGRAGAEQVARFLQLADGGVKNIKAFGDELVHLGNNFAATESQILRNALSIAQNTGAYNIARKEMLAYAAATSAVGIQSEVVGSAINRVLQQLSIASSGGKNATAVFDTLKITQSELADLLRNDASGAFKILIERLNEGYKSGEDLNSILREMGIRNVRDIRVVQTLATKGYDVLNDSMRKVEESASALNNEFETQSGKISAQIDRMRISWENLILSVDNGQGIFGRAMVRMSSGVANLFEGMSEVFRESKGFFGFFESLSPGVWFDRAIEVSRRPKVSGDPFGLSDVVGGSLDYWNSLRKSADAQDELAKSREELDESITRNRAFWAEEVKQLTELKNSMDVAEIGTKDWIDTLKELEEAQKQLDKYSIAKRPKSSGSTSLDSILDLGGNYYENKLKSIGREYQDLVIKIRGSGQSASIISDALGIAKASRDFKELQVNIEQFTDRVSKMRIDRRGLPTGLSGSLTVPNELPNLEQATANILKNLTPKITFGDELSRQTQRAITRGLVRGFDDILNNVNDLGSNFYEVFSNVFSKLSDTAMSTFRNALVNSLGEKFVDKLSKEFRLGNLSTDVSNAIVAGVGLGASLLGSNVFKPTSSAGQALSGGLGGLVTGGSLGSIIPGIGTVAGALGGAFLGGISGLFGSKSARKQERIQEAQLKEQELMRKELERQSALAWDARIVGQMSNLGLVSGIDRGVFGDIIARIDGKDIVLAYDRSVNSR